MIERIQIKNFKSIVDLELELGKLNVFIGENGCGKTNILEAITFGAAATANKLDNEFLSTRGIRVTDNDLMKSCFSKIGQTIPISVSTFNKENNGHKIIVDGNDYNKIYINPLNKSTLSIHSSENQIKSIDLIQGKDEDIDKVSKLIKSIMERSIRYLDQYEKDFIDFLNYAPENYFLRRFEEEGQIRPLGIRGEGLFKHLVDIYKKEPALLEKIGEHLRLIGWFEGFEIPTDLMFTERRINIKDKYLQELDFFDQRSANEGFLYLLFYFTLFLSPFTPKFFAIDNIDNSLNPKLCAELIRQLVKISKENEKQTILTTHNPAILDGLDLTDDSQRLFTIYRNAEGHTEAKRIKAPKTVKGVEPVRLSEAYIRGYLGGLPKNF